jgi:hypothetical protein
MLESTWLQWAGSGALRMRQLGPPGGHLLLSTRPVSWSSLLIY